MSGAERGFRVAEVFGPTIQGEGYMVGMPTFFVRIGGCDYRCTWCDSLHAVLPQFRDTWAVMTPREIAQALDTLGAKPGAWITLSGGNPALYDLGPLLGVLRESRFRVAVETQGSLWKPWLGQVDHLCLSPKPPSAGNETKWETFAPILEAATASPVDAVAVKVVVFDDTDYEYAVSTLSKLRATRAFDRLRGRLYLSVGNENTATTETLDETRRRLCVRFAELASTVAADARLRDVRVFPQLHTLAWGNALGV